MQVHFLNQCGITHVLARKGTEPSCLGLRYVKIIGLEHDMLVQKKNDQGC